MAFKRLSDATLVSSIADETNVLIEENGEIKRVSKSEVGGVKTVNSVSPDKNGNITLDLGVKSVNEVTPDENGNVTLDTASSWNDLKDRPFSEETIVTSGNTLTFDGNVEGLYNIDLLNGLVFVHISDTVPTSDQMLIGSVTMSTGETMTVSTDNMGNMSDSIIGVGEGVVMIAVEDDVELDGIIFNKKGIYVLKHPEGYASSITFPGVSEFTRRKVNTLNEEYIPSNISRDFIVNIQYTEDGGYIVDKTFAEIYSALLENRTVIGKMNIDPLYIFNVSYYVFDIIQFSNVFFKTDGMYCYGFTITNDNTIVEPVFDKFIPFPTE